MNTEWMSKLESHNPDEVQFAKQRFHEQFTTVRDSWLLNGLYDYYISSNSVRSMEILVNVPEPHHLHLFDKLTESIKGNKTDTKVQALTLLGHVLRRQPTWLYKIAEHQLLREILKRLKTEMEILPLLSALFVLIVLLPIIPSLMRDYLLEVFEIFSRLASWSCDNPGNYGDEMMVHMQVALYALFQRLYGMYPCNFLGFLRNKYRDKNLMPIFKHTIKPLLDSVKMHSGLVTASKENETTTARWKTMGSHDVIVECERLSLDVSDRCPHEACHLASFRSRSGTTNSATYESTYPHQVVKASLSAGPSIDWDYFSPSMVLTPQTPPVLEVASGSAVIPYLHVQGYQGASTSQEGTEGTSPPEAAIEATPETTPIKDTRLSHPYQNVSNVPKVLNFGIKTRARSMGSATTTPTHSQPSSPMRKEPTPFVFPLEKRLSAVALRSSYQTQKVQRLMHDRTQIVEPSRTTGFIPPTSPVRIIPGEGLVAAGAQRAESPVSIEDKEVVEIVERGEIMRQSGRECDSVLQESGRGADDDLETCEHEHNSPCIAGGLHTLNPRTMHDFHRHVRRLRYHSQCASEAEHQRVSTTGSSPGDVSLLSNNLVVRRANSCPEMKKGGSSSSNKDNISVTLDETDEETTEERQKSGDCRTLVESVRTRTVADCETQTRNIWPMPYEHLFLEVFPSMENPDCRPSPAPSPAPFNVSQERTCTTTSVYDTLDKYIDIALHNDDRDRRDGSRQLREQLQLLQQQLLFERHRRETHAFRNRRLLADARNTRALEEHNSALRDQVQLKQSEIDHLRQELDVWKIERDGVMKEAMAAHTFVEEQMREMKDGLYEANDTCRDAQKEVELLRDKCTQYNRRWQQVEARLVEAEAEIKIAKERVSAGERMRGELERMHRELLLAGELVGRYEERFNELSLARSCDQELTIYKEASSQETKALVQQLESKAITLEASKTRIIQLEQSLSQSDESITLLKKRVNDVKEDYHERLQSVESKYDTQCAITTGLEEKILELWQTLEAAEARIEPRPATSASSNTHSPATSSCQEAQPTSPLSLSLGSSESSGGILPPDAKDMQSLEAMADQLDVAYAAEVAGSININEPGPSTRWPPQRRTDYDAPGPSSRHRD